MAHYPDRVKTKTTSSIIRIAAIIGLLDSLYLAYVKLAHTEIYCTPGLGDCDVVNASRWSTLWGIPLGVYGVAGFGVILLISLFGQKLKTLSTYSDLVLFALSLGGFLFSLYLTYIELFILRAICQWCLLSALMMTVIFIVSVYELVVKSAKSINSGGN
ncbi:MAG TPA: vitamin K epoxide reductase family protein [Anaerolineaceae bacterium]|nr:vitamin K epoxide reductase family protein [Anaerolineaceae bacterium]